MSSQISLKELENKAFQSTIQDGMIEITVGCFLMMFSIAPILSVYLGDFWSAAVFLPLWAGVYYLIRVVRKKIIQPRVGIMKYGPYRKTRLKRTNLLMLIFNTAALILGFVSFLNFSSLPSWIIPARFSIIHLIGFSLAAYMLEYPRLFLYGIISSLAVPVGEFLYTNFQVPHHGLPLTFGVISGALFLMASITIWRIIKIKPMTAQEDPNG